jgi:hypothetical protein
MASYISLTLDTTAPGGVSVTVNGGDAATSDDDVTLTIATTDDGGSPTGYQMKVYGDVDDDEAQSEYRAAEGDAPWISFATSKSVKLSSGDGSKTVKVKVRDDVGNASSEATDSITLDTSVPVVTVTSGPSAAKISKVSSFDTVTFDWEADAGFDEYKVKVVATTGAAHSTGTQIPTTAGSSNVSGTAGDYPAETTITTTIKGADLETASAGDGAKVLKVFTKDENGFWSV